MKDRIEARTRKESPRAWRFGPSAKCGLWCLAALVGWLMQASVGAAVKPTASAMPEITDQTITRAVDAELLLDEGVAAHLIDTTTANGVVTLSGTVDNLLAKERAVKLAKTIRGVRAVVDQMTVRASNRTDRDIRTAIETALLSDPATDSYEVKVKVKDGVATLTGKVESWQEQQLSAQVAKGVLGVRDVKNEITWKATTNRPDLEIEADIKARLKANVWIDEALINVNVNNGQARLSGSVGSAIEKDNATSSAWVAGVASVNADKLEVRPVLEDANQRQSRYAAQPSDAEIKAAVIDAFLYDPRVYSFKPTVDVTGGVVTLSGTVDNLKAKRAAERDAQNTFGVWSVVNLLKVRPDASPEDEKLAKTVMQALEADPYLERWEVDVRVINQKAYLTGMVDSYFEKRNAELVASGVKGVVEVANNLTVDLNRELAIGSSFYAPYYGPWTFGTPGYYTQDPDERLRQNIQSQYFWSPFVDGGDITITVEDGVATLSGEVDSWREQSSAIDNAYQAGAMSVKSELKINGEPTS